MYKRQGVRRVPLECFTTPPPAAARAAAPALAAGQDAAAAAKEEPAPPLQPETYLEMARGSQRCWLRNVRRNATLQTQAAATHGEYVDAEDEDEEDEEIGGEREASEAANEKEANVSGGDALAATEKEPERRPNESPRSDGGDAASRALRVARDFFDSAAFRQRGIPRPPFNHADEGPVAIFAGGDDLLETCGADGFGTGE